MRPEVPDSIPKDNQQYAMNDFFNHSINRGYGSTLISSGIEGTYTLLKIKKCRYDNPMFCNYAFSFVETYIEDPSNLIRTEYILDVNGYNKKIENSIDTITSQYGVNWEDISTKEDRDHWVAGGKRQIIDLQTNKVVAEVIGYVMSTDPYRMLYTSWDGVKRCPENLNANYAANFVFSVLRNKEFSEYQSNKEKK